MVLRLNTDYIVINSNLFASIAAQSSFSTLSFAEFQGWWDVRRAEGQVFISRIISTLSFSPIIHSVDVSSSVIIIIILKTSLSKVKFRGNFKFTLAQETMSCRCGHDGDLRG